MPNYFYKAKKDNAQTVTGNVFARDPDEAVDLVHHMGLLPVSVVEKGEEESAAVPGGRGAIVRSKDIFAFTKQLVSLLKSGLPLLKSLEVLSAQTRNRNFGGIIQSIVLDIRNGRSFSAALMERPAVFTPLYVAMARAGEESGKLREFLLSISDHYRKQEEISSKVRSALAYPFFMFVVGVLTVAFILSFVMPRIMVLFKDLQTALPLPTQIVIKATWLLQRGWPVIFILVLLLTIFWRSFGRTARMRRFISGFFSTIPFVRELLLKIDLERFTRTLSLLLSCGIPILKALEIAVPSLSHDGLKGELDSARERVAGGLSLGGALQDSRCIPPLVVQLITVGEASGELSQSLRDLAETYEQEISETTKMLTTLIEPALILGVGLVIGFIVFAMLMPIFQMDMFAR
jgi:type II secretory pathway component PulF